MICRLFMFRSSPPPSLRLDHRVGSNGVKHQTHFLSHEQSLVASSKVHLLKFLMGIFAAPPKVQLVHRGDQRLLYRADDHHPRPKLD